MPSGENFAGGSELIDFPPSRNGLHQVRVKTKPQNDKFKLDRLFPLNTCRRNGHLILQLCWLGQLNVLIAIPTQVKSLIGVTLL